MVSKDHLSETAYHESNRHVTDDVTLKDQGRDPKFLKLSISTTVRDTWSDHIDYQLETACCESSGHVTEYVT